MILVSNSNLREVKSTIKIHRELCNAVQYCQVFMASSTIYLPVANDLMTAAQINQTASSKAKTAR
jgi:hypothetical protein